MKVIGFLMYILSQKLKALKAAIKVWNKEVFGDVHNMVASTQPKLDAVQKDIDSIGYTVELNEQELFAQQELQSVLSYQEQFWREKARINWFTQGDRNTSFFHRLTKVRLASSQLSFLKAGENILDNQAYI